MRQLLSQSALFGIGAATILLGFYFSVLTFISGWEFAKFQFFTYWYFIIALAAGFGIQVGLYSYLKNIVQHQSGSGKIVAVSGTTSTVAMVSCCFHYLVNLLPILGIAGFITLISQYQVQLFWVGLVANLLGIVYMLNRIQKFRSSVKL